MNSFRNAVNYNIAVLRKMTMTDTFRNVEIATNTFVFEN